jgi:hypothetical protein
MSAAIDVIKFVNSQDADSPTGPRVRAGRLMSSANGR